jgi:hypothetical protein
MSYLPPVFCRRAHVLFMLFVFLWVHYILCSVFVLFVFVLSLLPVSLDSTFLIPPSVFSDFYLRYLSMFVLYVSCVSNICQIYFTCYLFIST